MRKYFIWFRLWLKEIRVFFLFVLLSLTVTYPTIVRMNSYLYGQGGDSLGAIWRFWWLKYAYINHYTGSFSHLLAVPFGVDLGSLPISVVVNFLGKWLAILTNEVFAHNLLLLLSFPLAAITLYYLVHYFTKNKIASVISGLLYTLCPYHFVHAGQHLNLASIQWLPLYFLTLFKLDESRGYKDAVLCAVAFSLALHTHYYYGYFMAIFTGVFILWRIWQGLRRRPKLKTQNSKVRDLLHLVGVKRFKRLLTIDYRLLTSSLVPRYHYLKVVLVAAVVALAIILPATYPIFKNILSPKTEAMASLGYERAFSGLFTYSAQFFHYLIPSADNPFIGGFTRNFIKVYHPVEQTLYLGWVGIILSIVAVREWRRKNREQARKWESERVRKRETEKGRKEERGRQGDRSPITDYRSRKAVSFFLFAGIMALIFSHAPWTDIGPFRIFFPSCFLYKIAPMFRVYARFGVLVMLSVSVLAGIGLAGILQKIKTPQKRGILVALIVLLIGIEFAPILPAPMLNAFDPPLVYEWLSKQEGDFIVAEYPMENDVEYLLWQRIHQKRLINGALPGTHADKMRKKIVDILDPRTPGILKYLGAKYIVFHPGKYAKSDEVEIIGEVPDIKGQSGLKLVESFPETAVYEIIAPSIEPEVSKEGRETKDE